MPLISANPVNHKRVDLTLSNITKFVASGKRTIRGIASTDALDRQGDVVDPHGGIWTLPIPLLWQHRHDTPIGWVRDAQVRGSAVAITAELAEGVGKADEVWQLIEANLVSSYSIGFRGLKSEPLPKGGRRYTSWELLEVSVVTIPANSDAKISRAAGSVPLVSAKGANR